jgi:hypothetical protein
VDPVPDPLLLGKSGSAGNRSLSAGNRSLTSGSVARNSDHYTTEAVSNPEDSTWALQQPFPNTRKGTSRQTPEG